MLKGLTVKHNDNACDQQAQNHKDPQITSGLNEGPRIWLLFLFLYFFFYSEGRF